MSDELPSGRVTARDIWSAVNALRDELRDELRDMERRTDARVEALEVSVRRHEDIVQQLRGARQLVALLIGSNLLAAISAIVAVVVALR